MGLFTHGETSAFRITDVKRPRRALVIGVNDPGDILQTAGHGQGTKNFEKRAYPT
jgi:hypothetical protein